MICDARVGSTAPLNLFKASEIVSISRPVVFITRADVLAISSVRCSWVSAANAGPTSIAAGSLMGDTVTPRASSRTSRLSKNKLLS